jgi:two-component system aerobic respiration control sensor histidine kinase ArcB
MADNILQIAKSELATYGKAYDLLSCSLFVINKKLNIEYINNHTKKSLGIKNSETWLNHSFLNKWEEIKFPDLFDTNLNCIHKNPIIINKKFWSWEKIHVLIDSDNYLFLIGREQPEINNIYETLEKEISTITGYSFDQYLSIKEYISEISRFLSNMINRIPCYVYWKNKNLEYIGCNEMVANFLKLQSTNEIIGKTDFDFFSDTALAESYRDIDKQILNDGIPILRVPQELINYDGEIFHTLVSKVPIKDPTGDVVGILGITIDITKEKQAEIAKTEFLANMSHDIRTPLSGVIGLSDILEHELTDPNLKEDAHQLYESGIQLLTMLNEILDDVKAGNSNEQDIKKETFDLYKCIDDLIKLEAPTTAAKNLGLKCDIKPSVPRYIVSDRKKIHHILLNLLGNAVKFTDVGHITIEVNCLEYTASDVHLQFGVADTGIGIPENLQSKVFDRFFRVNPTFKGIYKGHGLGLNIVQSYVRLLGGHVTLTSKENVGTTFYFDLQCSIGKKEDVSNNNVDVIINESQKKLPINSTLIPDKTTLHKDHNAYNLLLIEDNNIALKVLKAVVFNAGYNFTAVDNGEKALEIAKNERFDLIITDIGLPGISGLELTKKIREWESKLNKSPTPIIGLSGHTQNEARVECISYGMNDLFSKPINASILDKMVHSFLLPNNKQPQVNLVEINSNKLGVDLPDSEEELFNLDVFPIFDPKEGLKYTNSIILLIELLKDFISDAIQQDIKNMEKAYINGNWDGVEQLAHKIKGGAAVTGVKRMQYACQYLERYYKAGHRTQLNKLYLQIIDVNKETVKIVSDWIKTYEKI